VRTGGEGWGGGKWKGGEREGGEGGEGEEKDGEGVEIGPPRIFDKFTPMKISGKSETVDLWGMSARMCTQRFVALRCA